MAKRVAVAKRVAMWNNKGGVGKTTSVVALAEAAAIRKHRVLVVDMDPQANATRRLGVKPAAGATLATCLQLGVQESAAKDYVHPHGWQHLPKLKIDVLPASLALEDRTPEAAQLGSHYRLQRALFEVDTGYDLTIIDCPPSVGHLVAMVVSALNGVDDTVLVPVEPDQDAIIGAMRVVDYIRYHRDLLGAPDAAVTGLIINKIRTRVSVQDARLGELGSVFQGVPIVASVPMRARLAEMQDAGMPLSTDRDLDPILAEFDQLVTKLMMEKKP